MRLQEQRWEEIAKATGRSPRTVRRVLEDVQRIWTAMAGIEFVPDAQRGNDSQFQSGPDSQRGNDSAALAASQAQIECELDYRD